MRKADYIVNGIRVPLDVVMLLLAGVATYLLRTHVLDAIRPVLFGPNLSFVQFMLLVAGMTGVMVLTFSVSGLYSMRFRMSKVVEAGHVVVASSAAMMAAILVIFLRAELFHSRFLVLGYWGMAMLFVIVGRLVLRWYAALRMARSDVLAHRVLVLGHGQVAHEVCRAMAEDPSLGYRVVSSMEDLSIDALRGVLSRGGIDEVVLAEVEVSSERIVELIDACYESHVMFQFVPNAYQTFATHYDINSIGRIPLVHLRRTPLEGWGRVFKRVVDVVCSVFALMVLLPVFVVVALCIMWDTPGPVFVVLQRVSRNRTFGLIKFRSMVQNAEALKPALEALNERADGPLFKMRVDPRVTRVGRILRKYRIDELPQFANVLRGDISLVGPRPHQPDEIARYQKHHKKVLAIKAGATGLAQVSGSSDLPFEEEVQLDTFYIENWSFWMDIRILIKTAVRLLVDRSAV
jgi:exopolysaccharide biosynthesis polyprenyl glycosylphosphotransferase